MKKIFVFGLAAALAAGTLAAATVDRQAALDSLVATENAFSRTAGEKGFRDAFIDYFADDSVLFRPDPVNGREFMRSRPKSPAFLSWYPIFADLSLAGDLGYTTGPWEMRAKGKDDPEVAASGDFATLWQKQPDGTWKVKLDHGPSHPPPPSRPAVSIPPARPAKVETGSLPKVDVEAERKGLDGADRAFAKSAEKGTSAAYLGVLADSARVYREDQQPALDRDAIRALLAKDPAAMTWEPVGTVVAVSGDLGSTYGIAKSREGEQGVWVSSHNYFRVWRKQQDGSWKVVLDVMTPRPKPVEKPVEKKPASGG